MEHFEKIESYLPMDLITYKGFILAFLVVLFFILVRYFLMVGAAYYIFWKTQFFSKKIKILHDRKLPKDQIKLEIKYSLIASIIFSISGVGMGMIWQSGYSQIYTKFDEYGLSYLFISLLVYSIIHEFYFYFTHVWMHNPKIFKQVHLIHHKSVKTSPWASFSFHPWETIVHAIFLPVMILFIPIHPVVLIIYLTIMTLTAISNHLGAEILPSKFLRSLFISGEHHCIHHTKMNSNFGLYYTFVDKIFATEYLEKSNE